MDGQRIAVIVTLFVLVFIYTYRNSNEDNGIDEKNIINYFNNKNATTKENSLKKKEIAKVIIKSKAFKIMKKEKKIVKENKKYYLSK